MSNVSRVFVLMVLFGLTLVSGNLMMSGKSLGQGCPNLIPDPQHSCTTNMPPGLQGGTCGEAAFGACNGIRVGITNLDQNDSVKYAYCMKDMNNDPDFNGPPEFIICYTYRNCTWDETMNKCKSSTSTTVSQSKPNVVRCDDEMCRLHWQQVDNGPIVTQD